MADVTDIVDLKKISGVISDEKKSLAYLVEAFLIKHRISCPSCGRRIRKTSDLYLMSNNKVKCRVCRGEFRPLSRTKFSALRLPYSDWLSLILLFELGMSTRRASRSIKASYKTVLKAFMLVRMAIAEGLAKDDTLLKGEIELDESYFGGHRKGNRGRGAAGKTDEVPRDRPAHVRLLPKRTGMEIQQQGERLI